jgi:drug/metabolite transporter (DMT)-like permease
LSRTVPEPIGLSTALIAVMVSVLWGGNIVSIRVGVESVPPLWSAFWRMLIGVIFVAGWAMQRGVPMRPAAGETVGLLALGLLFTVQIAMLNVATTLTSPAYGVVILNSYAIFANLSGHLGAHYSKGAVQETPLTGIRVVGLGLAVAGVAWLAFGKPDEALAPHPLWGNLLMVTSSLLLGVRQVYTRWLVQRVDPVRSVVWQMLLSVPAFLVFAMIWEPPLRGALTGRAVAAIAYQGVVVAGICFIIWAELLKRHAAGTLSMFAFIVPVCGIFLSTVIFHERLHPGLFGGTVLVLSGVFVVLRLGQGSRSA